MGIHTLKPVTFSTFELPTELQHLVFAHELLKSDAITNPVREPPLLLAFPTNTELREIYYSKNSFVIIVEKHNITPFLDFSRKWLQMTQSMSATNLRIRQCLGPGNRNWYNLTQWLHSIFTGCPVKLTAQVHPNTEQRVLELFMDVIDIYGRRGTQNWASIERHTLPEFRELLARLHPEWLL
ncbi:hypothetical protein TI39_contig4264g00001 [Zymoseptoria brevis]|uniref:Uncharacterized protein n=1 Tax=Zymoseptoria brevis TaxID=1047168 RepID=A0A0F4G9P9_9PEZI|nr:hypothetical protein TI39_contig4264g00001 [Zymoseptoria brevis]